VCLSCWNHVKPMEAPWCASCGYAFPSKVVEPERALCGPCRRGLYLFDAARAYGPFQDPLNQIVHQLKYHRHPSLARPLASRLAACFEAHREVLQADGVVPVPLHRTRERERGFNQASEIAQHFGKLAGLEVHRRWLVRMRATQVQAGLSRRERRLNVRGAFKLAPAAKASGRTLLLIDDVFTTGATLNECARILKEHGTARVVVLTVARVIRD